MDPALDSILQDLSIPLAIPDSYVQLYAAAKFYRELQLIREVANSRLKVK